ncbi:MAG TPA: large conductance mechanosensitive channel protein MscL [Mycobacteriales bacterium]|nr:large conductance mechanosensitive channel protein MscL [Mycobacteriales bacterium]
MIKGFRDFILRGNVVDLAVAVVIGAAFKAIVDAFTKDIITPIIAAIGGQPDFSQLTFTIHKSKFLYGDLINNIVSFLIIAAVVYFMVVLPVNRLLQRFASGEVEAAAPDPQVELLGEIRDLLAAGRAPAKATRARSTT